MPVVRILDIHPRDAYYENREGLIGRLGDFSQGSGSNLGGEWKRGRLALRHDDGPYPQGRAISFYAVQIEEVT